MSIRVARSLLHLRAQVDALVSVRDTSSDGTLAGDAHHIANPNSDHEAWVVDDHGDHVVTAMDITHDPHHGVNTYKMADALLASRDPRIKYVISNRRIGSATVAPWTWRAYHGENPHDHHVHVSVVSKPQSMYDDERDWKFGDLVPDAASPPPPPPEESMPTLRLGSRGPHVTWLQTKLGIVPADGIFGGGTRLAVIEFQKHHGLTVDGTVGQMTWKAIKGEAA